MEPFGKKDVSSASQHGFKPCSGLSLGTISSQEMMRASVLAGTFRLGIFNGHTNLGAILQAF